MAQIIQTMEDISDANFEQATGSSRVVLVYCWAPWCGSCRIMAPVLETLANDYRGKAKFCKLNTDDNAGVASQFHIRSLPMIFIFVDGKVVDQVVGAASQKYVEERLNRHL